MAKKINFINEIQGADVTANEAVKNSVPTWCNREKTGYQNHDYVLQLEAELAKEKAVGKAIKAERRKTEKRETEERRAWIDAIVAISRNNAEAMKVFAERGIVYSQVTPSGVANIHNRTLRAEATVHNGSDTLNIPEEATVQDASVIRAKKTATAKTTAKKTATAKKDTTTATTEKKTTTAKTTTGKGNGKYTPKTKKGVQYEDEYTVTAKNGVVYRVGHFHHTKTDEELWAVSAVEYSDEAKTWLKDTFGVYWSAYAGGFIFSYKPDTYLRRGVAKKTTAKKTEKKNA